MSAEDYIPDWYPDDEAEDGEVACRYCHVAPLYWEEARGEHNRKKWVLVDGLGNIHNCPKRPGPASADEFPMEEPC